MAYDRFDTRDAPRERSRWPEGRSSDPDFDRSSNWRGEHRRHEGGRDERGFFERAGDEISSWFGDEDAERRRSEDHMRDERTREIQGQHRHSGDRGFDRGQRNFYETRGINDRGGFA